MAAVAANGFGEDYSDSRAVSSLYRVTDTL